MITEDYVSFETAQLLKEKGFEGEYHMYYIEDGKYKCDNLHDIKDYAKSIVQFNYLHNTKIPAPTLQMAMKWLREIYFLEIYPYHDFPKVGDKWWFEIIKYPNSVSEYESETAYNSYEESAEAAIKYALENLI